MKTTRQSKSGSVKTYCGEIVVGIDSHKRDYHVCLWNVEDDRKLLAWVQPSDDKLLMEKLELCRGQITQIVYEAGSVGFALARNLITGGWPAIVTSPADMPISRNEPKSDRRDAIRLARLAARRLLSPIHIPTPQHESERAFQRQRQQFLTDKKRHQLRIKMLMMGWGIKLPDNFNWREKETRELPGLVTSVDRQLIAEGYVDAYFQVLGMVKRCDARLDKLKKREHNKKPIQHLCTIPGVASRTALEFILEMGPRGRFQTKHQVAKYQGLAPDVRSSGQSRKEGPLSRSGNRRLKTLLIEAAWRWRRYDDHARAYYNRLLSNSGCAQKAITALAHKLGIVMWNIMEQHTDYLPGGRNPRNTKHAAAKPKRARATPAGALQHP